MSEDAHSDGGAVLMDVTNTYEAQQGQLFLHLLENLRICQLAACRVVDSELVHRSSCGNFSSYL